MPPSALHTLLSLPFAKHVLAFERVCLMDGDAAYEGIYPYCCFRGEDYVRWGLDSIERLLPLPHDEVLDEALMRLAVHTGEKAEGIATLEIRDELRWMCTRLQLVPPQGLEAVKLYTLGVLEDMASGVIPAERTRVVLSTLHGLLWGEDGGEALERISDFYWQLDEWIDLRRLHLEPKAPGYDDILQHFRHYAGELVKRMKVELHPEGGLWHIRVSIQPAAT